MTSNVSAYYYYSLEGQTIYSCFNRMLYIIINDTITAKFS